MAFTDATLNAAVGAVTALGSWISAHTADPGTTGANEVAGGSYARLQTTWGSASSGDQTGSQVSLQIPASTTITHWGIWSLVSGGTFVGGFELDNPEGFGSAGVLKVTPTIDTDNFTP
jgi:hypothetical protein